MFLQPNGPFSLAKQNFNTDLTDVDEEDAR